MNDADGFGPENLLKAVPVPRETVVRLAAHRALLESWAPRINLIGPQELAHYWRRHALDSLQLLLHAPDALHWVDLGSGAGFPGLVLACGLFGRADAEVRLIEPNAKRAAFLREAIRATGAPARVLAVRAETIALDGRQTPIITARALAPLPRIIHSAAAMFARGAVGLFLKGADVEIEIALARRSWEFTASLAPSLSDPRGRIVRLEGVAPCPT